MKLALLLVVLGGCNAVFDIKDTREVVVDRDSDGILDEIDNCPDLANPLQENQDHDAWGDVCDACPGGSNHDEDGDGVLDGCDVCPQVADPDQKDSDGDGIGDACDLEAGAQRRVLFDGFAELAPEWIADATDWQIVDDAAVPEHPYGMDEYGLWNRHAVVSGQNWSMETTVDLDDSMGNFGLFIRSTHGFPSYVCLATHTSNGWQRTSSGLADPIPAPAPGPHVIRAVRRGPMLYCSIDGMEDGGVGIVDTLIYAISISAMTPRPFAYVDVLTGP